MQLIKPIAQFDYWLEIQKPKMGWIHSLKCPSFLVNETYSFYEWVRSQALGVNRTELVRVLQSVIRLKSAKIIYTSQAFGCFMCTRVQLRQMLLNWQFPRVVMRCHEPFPKRDITRNCASSFFCMWVNPSSVNISFIANSHREVFRPSCSWANTGIAGFGKKNHQLSCRVESSDCLRQWWCCHFER